MKQMKVIQSPKLESDRETVNSQLDALIQKKKKAGQGCQYIPR